MNPIPNALTEDVENGRVPLGRLLVEAGLLTDSQVDDALYEGAQTGERLGEIAVRRGMLSEEDLAKTLAEQWSLSYVDRASIFFDPGALASLSREDAQQLEAMPTRVQDGRIVVAVAEPTEQRIQALREVIGEDTVMVVVPRAALDAALSSELLTSRTPPSEREALRSAAAEGEGEGRAQARPGVGLRAARCARAAAFACLPRRSFHARRRRRSRHSSRTPTCLPFLPTLSVHPTWARRPSSKSCGCASGSSRPSSSSETLLRSRCNDTSRQPYAASTPDPSSGGGPKGAGPSMIHSDL